MTIAGWLAQATHILKQAGIQSARLDALLLLGQELSKDKAWLLAHGEDSVPKSDLEKLEQLLHERRERRPMAYIRGVQEFYGREFEVNDAVLIPRPETETLIDELKSLCPQPKQRLLDVGTGSGILAVTAALELPELEVHAADISNAALVVAHQNASKLGADVRFHSSDLLENIEGAFDYITANLPYVDPAWERSPETAYEPSLALFAGDGGLACIKRLIAQAPDHLTANGYLLLEADPCQHAVVSNFAMQHRFSLLTQNEFGLVLRLTG